MKRSNARSSRISGSPVISAVPLYSRSRTQVNHLVESARPPLFDASSSIAVDRLAARRPGEPGLQLAQEREPGARWPTRARWLGGPTQRTRSPAASQVDPPRRLRRRSHTTSTSQREERDSERRWTAAGASQSDVSPGRSSVAVADRCKRRRAMSAGLSCGRCALRPSSRERTASCRHAVVDE
jgi:hypothetical protein